MISNTRHYSRHQNLVLTGNVCIFNPPTPLPVSPSEGGGPFQTLYRPQPDFISPRHAPLQPFLARPPLTPAAPRDLPPPGPHLVKEAGDIVDSPVDHQPYLLRGVALRYLLQTVIGDGGLHPLPFPIAAARFHGRH